MKFPGFDIWRASRPASEKHKKLKEKYVSEESSSESEGGEDMFEAATMRAERQAFSQDQRKQLLRDLKNKYEITDLNESDLEELETHEMLTASEMLEGLAEKMKEVHAKLTHEEEVAHERQSKAAKLMEEMGMAGKAFGVDKKTREVIQSLDDRMKALIKLHKNVVSPLMIEAFKAKGRGEELLIPKPAEWEELMSETVGRMPPENIVPSPAELKKYEHMLQEDTEELNEDLDGKIDEINAQAALKEMSSMGGTVIQAFNFEENQRPHIEDLMKGDFEDLKKARQQIANIQLNLGMVQRLESDNDNGSRMAA